MLQHVINESHIPNIVYNCYYFELFCNDSKFITSEKEGYKLNSKVHVHVPYIQKIGGKFVFQKFTFCLIFYFFYVYSPIKSKSVHY